MAHLLHITIDNVVQTLMSLSPNVFKWIVKAKPLITLNLFDVLSVDVDVATISIESTVSIFTREIIKK